MKTQQVGTPLMVAACAGLCSAEPIQVVPFDLSQVRQLDGPAKPARMTEGV